MVFAIVAAVVANIIYIVDLVRAAIKMRREQKKSAERKDKGVEIV